MFLQVVLQQITGDTPLRVLDLCAAPGGKSTLLANNLPKDSLLVSNEVIKSRASILKENIIKWGCDTLLSPAVTRSIHEAERSVRLDTRGCPLFRRRHVSKRRESHHGMERKQLATMRGTPKTNHFRYLGYTNPRRTISCTAPVPTTPEKTRDISTGFLTLSTHHR